MEKKTHKMVKTKLTNSQHRLLIESMKELLGSALLEETKNGDLKKKEKKNVFLKYAVNSKLLN